MTIVFRFDAGGKYGLGHMRRSLELVSYYVKKKRDVKIVSTTPNFIKSKTDIFNSRALSSNILKIDKETDFLEILKKAHPSVVFIDKIFDYSVDFFKQIERHKVVLFHNDCSGFEEADRVILPILHELRDFSKINWKPNQFVKGLEYFIVLKRLKKLENIKRKLVLQ